MTYDKRPLVAFIATIVGVVLITLVANISSYHNNKVRKEGCLKEYIVVHGVSHLSKDWCSGKY